MAEARDLSSQLEQPEARASQHREGSAGAEPSRVRVLRNRHVGRLLELFLVMAVLSIWAFAYFWN